MKKGLIIGVVALAVVGCAAAGGYKFYQQKEAEKQYEEQMTQTINNLPPIVVYEHQDLPSVEEVFSGTEGTIDLESVQPDISNVSAEPGVYAVSYDFKDTKGNPRTASVSCEVKPDLEMHVSGMSDISIDKGDEVPITNNCTYDEYVDSVSLNTDMIDNTEAGIYDISYTILGVDGEMKTVDGYKCTVNEIPDPTPTPTPTPTPKPTATPKPKKTEEKKEDTKEEVGNVVEVQEQVVETGDENNIFAIVASIIAALGVAAGVVVYRKKYKN